jgi:hypothetical protein
MSSRRTAVQHDGEGVRDCLTVRHREESNIDGEVRAQEASKIWIPRRPRHVRRLAQSCL